MDFFFKQQERGQIYQEWLEREEQKRVNNARSLVAVIKQHHADSRKYIRKNEKIKNSAADCQRFFVKQNSGYQSDNAPAHQLKRNRVPNGKQCFGDERAGRNGG